MYITEDTGEIFVDMNPSGDSETIERVQLNANNSKTTDKILNVNTLEEQEPSHLAMWFGSQESYNKLGSNIDNNTLYYINDDQMTANEIKYGNTTVADEFNNLNNIISNLTLNDLEGVAEAADEIKINPMVVETSQEQSSKTYYLIGTDASSSTQQNTYGALASNAHAYIEFNEGSTDIHATKVYGAVWNDYAEYRECDIQEPGRVVCENGDDTLSLACGRMQPGANVISDTFGFAIGQTERARTPIAVSGRVLVYPHEDRNTFRPGEPVCSGPNGTVSKMSREEIINYPECIVGTVSAIPQYETWGENNIAVDGRIWIKVK